MSFGDQIWEEIYKTSSWGSYPSEEAIRFYMRTKRNFQQPEVLDIGSGQGALSWFMTREGAKVSAFDGAPTALKRLEELTASFGVSVENKIHGNILNPQNYINTPFDIMVDHYALYANPEEEIYKSYAAYHELLREGGFLLTCAFGEQCDGFGSGERVSENTWVEICEGSLKDRGMTTFWTEKRLTEVLTKIGFEIDYTEVIYHTLSGVSQEKIIVCAKKV